MAKYRFKIFPQREVMEMEGSLYNESLNPHALAISMLEARWWVHAVLVELQVSGESVSMARWFRPGEDKLPTFTMRDFRRKEAFHG